MNFHADTGDAGGVRDGQVVQCLYRHLGRDTNFASGFPVAIDCFFSVVPGLLSHLILISLPVDTTLTKKFHDEQQPDQRSLVEVT